MRTVIAKSGWVKSIGSGRSTGCSCGDARREGAVAHPGRADQRPRRLGLLDRPGGAAVEAAGQEELLGPRRGRCGGTAPGPCRYPRLKPTRISSPHDQMPWLAGQPANRPASR